MGFYDDTIKELFASCPRLVVLAVNSLFNQNYDLDTEVIYLDKEQNASNTTFMDELLQIGDKRYHIEFQMEESEMALRMFEYGIKEAVKTLKRTDIEKYYIEAIMPRQVVVFLAGANTEDKIETTLHLPDGQVVSYEIDCVSVAIPVKELKEKGLVIFAPFQAANLGKAIDALKSGKDDRVKEIAKSIVASRKDVKDLIYDLRKHDIISARELDTLEIKLDDVEQYLTGKNEKVEKEVTSMGDEDYIPFSKRVKMATEIATAEGRARGRVEGLAEGRAEGRAEGSNALYNAIQKLKAGATQEDLKSEGFDEHIIELALACK